MTTVRERHARTLWIGAILCSTRLGIRASASFAYVVPGALARRDHVLYAPGYRGVVFVPIRVTEGNVPSLQARAGCIRGPSDGVRINGADAATTAIGLLQRAQGRIPPARLSFAARLRQPV